MAVVLGRSGCGRTAIPLEACTDLIVAAFTALGGVSDLPR